MIRFFLPLLFGTFFQLLYNTADSIIVGQYVGKEALSAVGGASAILVNVFVGGLTALSSGVTVIVGQYYGAGRKDDVSKSVHTGIAFAFLLGVIITIAGIPATRTMLVLMNTPEDTLAGSVIYLQVYFMGMIPNLLYNMGAGILRAIGDSKRPLLFLVISSITNIILDLVLVLGLGLGVFGVAFATILSQAISAALTLYVLAKADDCYKLRFRQIRIHGRYLLRILAIGIPSTIHNLTYTASNVLIQTAINGFGTDTVAAWVATGKTDQIFWMMSSCMGITISTFVAQNYGAGNFKRVRSGIRYGFIFEASLTAAIEALLLTGGVWFLRYFTKDATVLSLATYMLKYLAFFYFTFMLIEVCSSSVRGMGDAVGPMLISVFGVCGIRIVWLLTVFKNVSTLDMLMMAYPVSWGISSAVYVVYLFIYAHRKNREIYTLPDQERKKNKMVMLILYAIGLCCIIYGITVMLANSGSKFYLCWIAGGVFLFALSFMYGKGIIDAMNRPVKGVFGCLIAAGFIFVALTQSMVISGFVDNAKENLDYIIVLGSQVKPSGPAVVTRLRLDKAYEYAYENPQTMIIVSGGQGSNEPASEASVMKDYLVDRGIDESRIIMEDMSTNTSENLRFSSALFDIENSSVGIVTSEFHVFRALSIAKKCGYSDLYGIPARSVLLYLPNNMIRETVGLTKDFLMGNL